MSHFRTLEVSDPALEPEGLRFVTVKSAALGHRADITLFVPPQAQALHNVPLVLLLHGVYGSHWAWAFKAGTHRTAQRLIDCGDIPPMVLAMPSDGLWGDGSGYVAHATQDFERWIVDDVPAAVREVSGACSEASPLFIAGLSMGGFGALRLVGKYTQRFAAAAAHSAITDVTQLDALLAEPRTAWCAAPQDRSVFAALATAVQVLPPLRFDCGRDDFLVAANRQLHAELTAAGIAHEYAEHDGAHGWDYWARHLEDTLRFFARTLDARKETP